MNAATRSEDDCVSVLLETQRRSDQSVFFMHHALMIGSPCPTDHACVVFDGVVDDGHSASRGWRANSAHPLSTARFFTPDSLEPSPFSLCHVYLATCRPERCVVLALRKANGPRLA